MIVAVPPDSLTCTSLIESVGCESLSVMWPVAELVPRLALVGLVSVRGKFSAVGPSYFVSLMIGTWMVSSRSPGTNVSVPLAGVKSSPEVAVPVVPVACWTVTVFSVRLPVSLTVKVTVPSASLTVTLAGSKPTVGGLSSSLMVPVAWLSANVAPTRFESVIV